MEHSPPPFFKRGPAPLVRLLFFASLSLALLILDARFRYAEGLRSALALAAYPLQRAATAPLDLLSGLGEYVSTQAHLAHENAALRARALELALNAQRYEAAEAEAAQLRRLIGALERLPVRGTPAEVLYSGRDPYSHRLFVAAGSNHGVSAGSPVADEAGLLGQVTRVHPLLSEVTLITDQNHAIPVQVVRTGLRAVAFGGGPSGMLELRFLSSTAEIQPGDRLVTSGIDGTYPAGLPVATVVRIERDAEHSFARVVCKPAAGVDRGRFVLVLSDATARPPRPAQAEPGKERRADKARRARMKEKDGDASR
ncbi:MAG TPA: rod shape-determining protein MreC [Burkholderiales bacterium]|nr:rod shape-determining protein MreC [Burkholderiales bacterium]